MSEVWEMIGFVAGNGNSNSPKEYSFTDKNPKGGSKYQYRLKQIDNDGQFEYSETVEVELVPTEFTLFQNYPNPFNPSTVIRYQLPVTSPISIKVYDVLGNEVVTLVKEFMEAGQHEVEFTANNLGSGIYIYKIQTSEFTETKKIVLLR